jgi:WD40 repeat protein
MRIKFSRRIRRFVTIGLVVSVSVVGLSCAFFSDLTSKPTETVSPQPTIPPPTYPQPTVAEIIPTENAPTDEPLPTVVPATQTGPTIPDRPLGSGPWLLIVAEDGMWAVNPDGSGLTHLTDEVPIDTQDIQRSASSRGGEVALVTSSDPLQMANLTMQLLHLPEGNLEVVTPLTSADTEPGPDAEPGSEDFIVAQALFSLHNLAWSPSGDQLAFMGAMDGPSSDLYVYSLASGEITQLTDGPSQGIRPTWSPDGETIVHAGVGSLGTGAGYDMQGIWGAKQDGSSVITLYPIPEESGDEIILGWISPSQFVVYTWNMFCGYKNLRTYDLASGKTQVLWENFFNNAVLSPITGHILVSVDEWTVDCNPGGSEGTFFLNPGEATPLQALDSGSVWMDWVPSAGVFLLRDESKLLEISPDGMMKWLTDAPGTTLPAVSPDGRLWAFAESVYDGEPGLWAGEYGAEAEKIFPGDSWDVTWSPGGAGLFFFSDDGLYFAPAPSFEPILIGEGLRVIYVEPMTWVNP